MELSPFLYGLYKLAKYGIYPLTWIFGGLGLSWVLLRTSQHTSERLRWARRLIVSSLLLLYLLGTPLGTHVLMGLVEAQAPPFDPGTGKHFDVIVALGGGAETRGSLRPSDEPSISSIRRTLCAATLFTQGLAPKVLFAGGDASIIGEGAEEAVVMKDLAVRLGVPEQAILVETRSRNTYENAVQVRLALGDASVLLVTSASHMLRALGLFRKQGLDTTSYPCGYYMQNRPEDAWDANLFDFLPSVEALYLNTLALIEVAGILVYSLTGKL